MASRPKYFRNCEANYDSHYDGGSCSLFSLLFPFLGGLLVILLLFESNKTHLE